MLYLFKLQRTYLTFNIIGTIISAGASLLGGVLANKANKSAAQNVGQFNVEAAREAGKFNLQIARETNAYNAEEAKRSRDWQTEMSNTAHQRQMDDLEAAGINPILTAQYGGAHTGPGAQATGVTATQPAASMPGYQQQDVITPAVNSAFKSETVASEVSQRRAQIQETLARYGELTYKQQERITSQIQLLNQQARHQRWDANSKMVDARIKQYTENMVKTMSAMEAELAIELLAIDREFYTSKAGNTFRIMENIGKSSSAVGLGMAGLAGFTIGAGGLIGAIWKKFATNPRVARKIKNYWKEATPGERKMLKNIFMSDTYKGLLKQLK